METTTKALEVTNFDFYGDELIAIRDNATGEIYTSATHLLNNIGFTERQIKHLRKKWSTDTILSKEVQKFVHPSNGGLQETICISQRKLPLALAKISITPNMRKQQPLLASRLELYQDKCADVLASVFIDHKSVDEIKMQPIINVMENMAQTISGMAKRLDQIEDAQANTVKQLTTKRHSHWFSKMYPKYQALIDFFEIPDFKTLYKNLYQEFENTHPDIDLNQIVDDYCYCNGLETCFTGEAIEHNVRIRQKFEEMVDKILKECDLYDESTCKVKRTTIFDECRMTLRT